MILSQKPAAVRMRKWRKNNRERNRQKDKSQKAELYRTSQAYRDKIRARNQRYWKRNKVTLSALNKAYRATPKGHAAVRACITRRRYKKRGAVIKDGAIAVKHLEKLPDKKCFYCETPLNGIWHVEHLIPISKGGQHSAANVVPACASCNLSKGDLLPNQFIKKGQLLLL